MAIQSFFVAINCVTNSPNWRSRSIYTPGFVLNGQEWRGWFNRAQLPRTSNKSVGTLIARSEDGKQWALHFQPTAGTVSSSYDFHAALLGFDLTSDVTAGENRGRNLEHDFVVLALAETAGSRSGDAFRGTLEMQPNLASAPKRFGF